MKPIDFNGSNRVYGKDQPEVLPLPAHYDESQGVITSCWEPTLTERLKILFSGKIWVGMVTYGKRPFPVLVAANPPEKMP